MSQMDGPTLFTSLVSLFFALYSKPIVRSPRTSFQHPRCIAPGKVGSDGLSHASNGL